ncbi:MAG: 4Fe-4S binding protein [Bacteroidetes bacterium]|nr:4Fe-4S binding protein [Bacteroidota bacterium]
MLVSYLSGKTTVDDKNTISKLFSDFRKESRENTVVWVGAGTCGLGAGAGKTIIEIKNYFSNNGINAEIIETGCIGLCSSEPIVDVALPGKKRISFENVTADKVKALFDDIFSDNVSAQSVIGQYGSDTGELWKGIPLFQEHSFFKSQKRIVLKNCGIIDPSSINEYIAHGGYKSIFTTLNAKTPTQVCRQIELSGLRGRGGGGFPTGKKWKTALFEKNQQKYLICNADEGDPGAFMDRAVIESDPHSVIEGMITGAFAIGASQAYIYIRAEYPLAISRLIIALEQAKSYGLLGKNIFNTGFDLEIKIKKGAGAFVCGEETALMQSIEGKRGMPKPRPPYPAVVGLFNKPTIINNVETFANVAAIMQNGEEWFSSIGTEKSKGTKVFALSGKVEKTGLVEIPMGTTLRHILFDIAGGVRDNKKFKAVQMGGPSGGCVTEENLDIIVDYDSLLNVGAMMGSGGMVVMDETTCMVDIAKFFMDFIQKESCGKCIPCREGTKRMLEILEAITNKPSSEDNKEALVRFQGVIMLEELSKVIKETSLCGLGQSAPNPVLSTIKWFRKEYEEHIFERKCSANICTNLRKYYIDAEKCTGCMACLKKCPSSAIIGGKKTRHIILQDKCIGCGACSDACKFNAIFYN